MNEERNRLLANLEVAANCLLCTTLGLLLDVDLSSATAAELTMVTGYPPLSSPLPAPVIGSCPAVVYLKYVCSL